MNKLLLTTVSAVALAISATAAMAAGSTTYITQLDTNQSATIDQSLSTAGSVVGTLGNPFTQDNGEIGGLSPLGAGGNVIAITQAGSYETFGVNAPSFQSGTANQASVGQAGSYNDAVLQQTGYNNGNAYDTISQAGTGSDVALEQNGTQNNFSISQDAYSNGSDFTAFQVGSYNLVSSAQTSQVWASIYQIGSSNSFYNTQSGYLDSFTSTAVPITLISFTSGELNTTYAAVQDGNNNLIVNNQWGPGATVLLGGQFGSYNNIYNAQGGNFGNLAYVAIQSGTFLTINNNQSGDWNLLNVNYQYGNNSSITNVQSGSVGSRYPCSACSNPFMGLPYNNAANVSQSADNSSISNTQTGSNGLATYTQFGSRIAPPWCKATPITRRPSTRMAATT